MTQEVYRIGIPIASHAIGGNGIINAIKNGVDTIEHGFYINEEAIELMFETDATFVPTLAIMHRIVTEGYEHGVPEWSLEKYRKTHDAHFDGARKAYEAGISIALGTDFMDLELLPNEKNTLEAELLVEDIGMDEIDVLKAAIGHAGRTCAGRCGYPPIWVRSRFRCPQREPVGRNHHSSRDSFCV